MGDFAEFERSAQRLARAAEVADYTWFWWKLRPHPRLGTVEVRALDVQSSLEDTAALAALTHCLALRAAQDEPSLDPPAEVLEEAIFRAARWGVEARLPDAEGYLHSVPELLERALELARIPAAELGCERELEALPALLARGGGAGRQRSAYAIAGMDFLLREMTRITCAAASAEEPAAVAV